MYWHFVRAAQYYGSVIESWPGLRFEYDPACVVSTASVYTYQAVHLKLDQGIEPLFKP